MHWYALGHAAWLAEIAGLRLLFDPLLDDRHHGGVFAVTPPRTVDAEALAPDFVFVSHRHPDHFDPASLARLARLDADVVVVTPDPLVETCARRLGFRTVRRIDAETRIDLDGPRILTTPSVGAADPEWGVMVEGDGGIVFDQVDTSLGTPGDVRAFLGRAAAAFERSSSDDAEPLVSLGLVRWQPLLEVESALAQSPGFPFEAYAEELERIVALGAGAIVPASAGARHARPFHAMNRLVYPVHEPRFLRDAAARMPTTRVLPFTMGARFTIVGREVEVDARGGIAAGLVQPRTIDPEEEGTDFRPLEIPPVSDPNLGGREVETLRAIAATWVERSLVVALAKSSARPSLTLRYLLEIVWPGGVDAFTIAVTGSSATLAKEMDPSWDVRCVVAGSMLCDVVSGVRSWGDLLLGGMLRGVSRAYEVDARGMRPIVLQPLFLYAAISYEESVERSLEATVHRLLEGSPS
ncbi:MAG: MBL fold metallo-hydrolase [Deltaproteobacteria bacterium]|nr:MBL fold metallo-hydrolase [Deltaproteobacteria bacterium]